jgi:hypothetical protein
MAHAYHLETMFLVTAAHDDAHVSKHNIILQRPVAHHLLTNVTEAPFYMQHCLQSLS